MFKLARYLRQFKKEVIFGQIFKLTEAVFELIVPLVMAKIIDVGIINKDVTYIFKMGGLMIFLGIIGCSVALAGQYLASKASQGIGTTIRSDIFKHINLLSHAEIDKIGTPSLTTRITNDVNQIQVAVAMFIRIAGRAPFLIIGATVMAISLDLKLSLIFLIIIPLVSFTLYMIMGKSIPFYHLIQKKLDRISLITRENLEGVRVIRAFSKQKSEENRFEEASDDLMKTSINVGKISALLNPLTYIIMNFAIIAIIWFGGIQVESGILTQGQIIAFVNYMTQISLALVAVANLVVIFTKASACDARIYEIFETKPSIIEPSEEKNVVENIDNPKIEFKNVFFSYHKNNEYALTDVSIKIFAGETVGVIGGTGSGKSTLVNLIPRFYDIDKGEILVDGINVKDYKFKTLRMKIGIVPQHAVLFSGTIAENMRWGCENAVISQIEKAIKIAQADEFIQKLQDGYDTKILQGGRNLSGGQKQRLTIARALVPNPQILILDDSASALDFATDAALRKAIKQNTENMTVLMISQRANTIKYADKIIVLDDGEVAGIGTHDELFQTCEVYREICLSQLSTDENDNA